MKIYYIKSSRRWSIIFRKIFSKIIINERSLHAIINPFFRKREKQALFECDLVWKRLWSV